LLAKDDINLDAFNSLIEIVFDAPTCDTLDRRGYMRSLFATAGLIWQEAWGGRGRKVKAAAKSRIPGHSQQKLKRVRGMKKAENENDDDDDHADEEHVETTPPDATRQRSNRQRPRTHGIPTDRSETSTRSVEEHDGSDGGDGSDGSDGADAEEVRGLGRGQEMETRTTMMRKRSTMARAEAMGRVTRSKTML
jgi:hypothetical protein